MNFTEERVLTKWKAKKKSCNKRKIPMLLTQEQFVFLHQHNDLVCDYTGLKMSTNHNTDNYISLERIDCTKPYQLGNICFVTRVANRLKGSIFDQYDKGQENAGISLKGKYREVFFQMLDVVRNHEYIQMLKEKYSEENVNKMMKKGEIKVNKIEVKAEATVVSNVNPEKPHNKELDITKVYTSFGTFIEQKCDSVYNLTYAQFKSLVSRKTCMLTKRQLPESIYQIGFFIPDKTKPVNKTNILVTSKTLQESLDKLMVESKLTVNELKHLVKVLGK